MTVLAWSRRQEALAPAGLVAEGAAMAALVRKLHLTGEEALTRFTLVATRDMVILLGQAPDLPWVDGARYCAPDPQVQTLWLPTTMQPVLPPDLLRRSASAHAGDGPLLLWDDPEQFLPLAQARTITPGLLAWLAEALR